MPLKLTLEFGVGPPPDGATPEVVVCYQAADGIPLPVALPALPILKLLVAWKEPPLFPKIPAILLNMSAKGFEPELTFSD